MKSTEPSGRVPIALAELIEPAVLADREQSVYPPAGVRATQRRFFWLSAAICSLIIGSVIFTITLHFSHGNSTEETRVGIVPFETEGDGAEQLGRSIRLEMADTLSQLPRVQVKAMHSLTNDTYTEGNTRQLASALNLDILIFTNLRIANGRFELRMELVGGKNAVHEGSLEYAGKISELSVTRDRIQSDIFSLLRSESVPSTAHQGSTDNPEAYAAFLKGRADLAQRTEESLRRADEEFQTAIRIDPKFARAHAGEASTLLLIADHGSIRSIERYHDAAREARLALDIYPDLAEAHAVIGFVLFRADWNFALSEQQLNRAISLDPNQPLQHLWLALLLSTQGRSKEALIQMDEARAEDPHWPAVLLSDAFVSSYARNWVRAHRSADDLVHLMPNWSLAHDQRGWVLWCEGAHEEAVAEWHQVAILDHDKPRVALEDEGLTALRRGGKIAYARLRLAAARSGRSWIRGSDDFEAAEWSAFAGDLDGALNELNEQIDRRDPKAVEIASDPAYDALHGNPRFTALLARIGLLNGPK